MYQYSIILIGPLDKSYITYMPKPKHKRPLKLSDILILLSLMAIIAALIYFKPEDANGKRFKKNQNQRNREVATKKIDWY
jgi:hypothetical protein